MQLKEEEERKAELDEDEMMFTYTKTEVRKKSTKFHLKKLKHPGSGSGSGGGGNSRSRLLNRSHEPVQPADNKIVSSSERPRRRATSSTTTTAAANNIDVATKRLTSKILKRSISPIKSASGGKRLFLNRNKTSAANAGSLIENELKKYRMQHEREEKEAERLIKSQRKRIVVDVKKTEEAETSKSTPQDSAALTSKFIDSILLFDKSFIDFYAIELIISEELSKFKASLESRMMQQQEASPVVSEVVTTSSTTASPVNSKFIRHLIGEKLPKEAAKKVNQFKITKQSDASSDSLTNDAADPQVK